MLARFVQGFGSDAANATGANTIADSFFSHERGAKTGLWTYPTTIGYKIPNKVVLKVDTLILGHISVHLSADFWSKWKVCSI